MANLSGVTAFLGALRQPQVLRPHLVVSDIARLDWARLRSRGYTGVVIDKDNCITRPDSDELVPAVAASWAALLSTFGAENVLIVSNSAGSSKDSLSLQAETLARNTGAPVLVHKQFKPSRKCVADIEDYFVKGVHNAVKPRVLSSASPASSPRRFRSTNLNNLRLLVIGDRVSTDMILANRLRERIRTSGILTTRLHAREGFGTTLIRRFEMWWMRRHLSVPQEPSRIAEEQDLVESILPQGSEGEASTPERPTRINRATDLWKETQQAWMSAAIDNASPFRRWEALFGSLQDSAAHGVRRFDGAVEKARWMGAKWQLGLPLRSPRKQS